jgi:hypothetical protein
MSTLHSAVKGLIIAASLLAASTTLAGDITSDRQQLSLRSHTGASERKGQATPVENDAMESATAQLCSCASAKDPHGVSGHQR